MKVDLDRLVTCLSQIEETFPQKLQIVLGRSAEFNEGFLYALSYARKFIVPAIEEEEQMQTATALFQLNEELQELKGMLDELQKEFEELQKDEDDDEPLGPDI